MKSPKPSWHSKYMILKLYQIFLKISFPKFQLPKAPNEHKLESFPRCYSKFIIQKIFHRSDTQDAFLKKLRDFLSC